MVDKMQRVCVCEKYWKSLEFATMLTAPETISSFNSNSEQKTTLENEGAFFVLRLFPESKTTTMVCLKTGLDHSTVQDCIRPESGRCDHGVSMVQLTPSDPWLKVSGCGDRWTKTNNGCLENGLDHNTVQEDCITQARVG